MSKAPTEPYWITAILLGEDSEISGSLFLAEIAPGAVDIKPGAVDIKKSTAEGHGHAPS
jgi:hypothetical protein